MMRVFYGVQSGHAHRYQCRGDDAHVGAGLCIGIGGIRVDRAVTAQMLEAVSGRAVEAALIAAEKAVEADGTVHRTRERDLEAARYDASLAATQHWSALCRSSGASRIWMLLPHHDQRWIAMR